MRRTWKCPKCGGHRVGYLEEAFSGERARRVGFVKGAVFGIGATPAGSFEAFVCTDCGYFEEYVKNPAQMPWDKVVGFRWCQPEHAPTNDR